jgi:hypothetical protein
MKKKGKSSAQKDQKAMEPETSGSSKVERKAS